MPQNSPLDEFSRDRSSSYPEKLPIRVHHFRPRSPESTLALFCQNDNLRESHFSYFIGPRVSAVLRKYHSNEIIWFINPVWKPFITDQCIYGTSHSQKKAKMRQNRKLPGQNPFTGQNNVPKSDSRTQMLRSGSNETDGKARDLQTDNFTESP